MSHRDAGGEPAPAEAAPGEPGAAADGPADESGRAVGDPPDAPGSHALGRPAPSANERVPQSPAMTLLALIRETVLLVVLAIVLAVVFKTFLVQAFYIPSGSMEPTLQISDRVLVEKLSYRFGTVHRGDVIVFVHDEPGTVTPESTNPVARFLRSLGQAIGVTRPSDSDFIKRVMGLPGDKLDCSGGHLLRNGHILSEPYLPAGTVTECGPATVPKGHLFVMGDNRTDSKDSRFFGPIERKTLVGRAFVRIWPFGRFGGLGRTG